jgi:hypothetical protein
MKKSYIKSNITQFGCVNPMQSLFPDQFILSVSKPDMTNPKSRDKIIPKNGKIVF